MRGLFSQKGPVLNEGPVPAWRGLSPHEGAYPRVRVAVPAKGPSPHEGAVPCVEGAVPRAEGAVPRVKGVGPCVEGPFLLVGGLSICVYLSGW
jgi:hypothetical protein